MSNDSNAELDIPFADINVPSDADTIDVELACDGFQFEVLHAAALVHQGEASDGHHVEDLHVEVIAVPFVPVPVEPLQEERCVHRRGVESAEVHLVT